MQIFYLFIPSNPLWNSILFSSQIFEVTKFAEFHKIESNSYIPAPFNTSAMPFELMPPFPKHKKRNLVSALIY